MKASQVVPMFCLFSALMLLPKLPVLAADEGETDAPVEERQAEAKSPGKEESRPPPGLPTLNLPSFDLPAVPGVDGLRVREPDSRQELPERSGLATVEFTVHTIEHARAHRPSARGCVAQDRLEGFRVERFPVQIDPFSSCIRLSADRAVIARLRASIVDETGREVADATGEVSFSSVGKTIDYVVDWVGFPARNPGAYHVIVVLDRIEVGRFPIEVAAR